MGLFQLLSENNPKSVGDHVLHFIVAAFIVVMQIIEITNADPNPDSNPNLSSLARTLAALLVAGMGIQAAYHFGVGLKYYCTDKQEEAGVGVVARNLLTSLSLTAAAARAGVLEAGERDSVLAWVVFGALVVMKLLDLVLDGEPGEAYAMTMCPSKFNGEDDPNIIGKFGPVGPTCFGLQCQSRIGFTGRMIITHMALIPSALILLINHNAMDHTDLTIALIAISIHAFLYPAILVLNLFTCGNFNKQVIECLDGDGQCDTLESLSRVPIVRTIVTLVAIPSLSYAVGHEVAWSWDLTLALALYLGADAVGRNVV